MTRANQRSPHAGMVGADDSAQCRLDKWLWAARFYKTRSLATEAVDAGHVRINGVRPKPARAVKLGDRVSLVRGDTALELTITALSDRRGSAAVASNLYLETPESIADREKRRLSGELQAQSPRPTGKPSKRDRRQLQQFLGRD